MKLDKLIFTIGILIFLYPTLSDTWNQFHQSQVISRYQEKVERLDAREYEACLNQAKEYNEKLGKTGFSWNPTKEEQEEYKKVLAMYQDGMMGYIEIPSIQCRLSIYHGTEEAVLQVGVGHLEGSSLPVGGKSSHCILSGHRGLTSARLFTGLDRLKEGDVFSLSVLGETLYYQVDQIKTVLPEETENLSVEEGKDFCTLVTCTPYGVNTHRLLVRGSRIEGKKKVENQQSNRGGGVWMQIERVGKWILVLFLILLFWGTSKIQIHGAVLEQEYEIEVQYEFPEVELCLYRIEKSGGKGGTEGILWQRKHTDVHGIAVFSHVPEGEYQITGESYEEGTTSYLPVSVRISVPFHPADVGKKVRVTLKYEKKEADHEDEIKKDPILPKTGQLWWPVSLLAFCGLFLICLGRKREKCQILNKRTNGN